MRRQRNNVTRLPYELRRVVNRMLFEGAGYEQVRLEVAKLDFRAPPLHNTSLGAWQRSPEYIRYRDARESDDVKTSRVRAIAEAQNDGRGPQSTADVIVSEVLDALLANVEGGKVTDLGDLGVITKAIAPILRAQISAEAADAKRREQDLTAQLAAQDIAHEAEMAERQRDADKVAAEIVRLQALLETHGIKAEGGSGQGLSAGTVERLKRIYGI